MADKQFSMKKIYEDEKINHQKIQNHQDRQNIAATDRIMPFSLQNVGRQSPRRQKMGAAQRIRSQKDQKTNHQVKNANIKNKNDNAKCKIIKF